ncbi:MAG: ribonuclease H-like domain-containing protein [Thermomicrobiales bacterium]
MTGTGAQATGTVAAASALRERLAALSGARQVAPPRPAVPSRPAVTLAGGYEEETPFGPCYLIERRYPLDHRHGPQPLGALTAIAPDLLAALGGDARLAALPHERLVLLDTETTGLAGGTGTYVFLVGLGFLTADAAGPAFVVRQYFLRELREERALLHALGATLTQFGALVTFNGKSFDWPLLATRYTLARQAPPAATWPHLDLLHPARRVWKHRLPSCSLGSLEAAILDVQRVNDIPGALIPDLYFRYLRDGDSRPLLPVLAHNEADIISLAALLIYLGQLAGPDGLNVYPDLPGADRYGLATLQAALGRHEASIAALRGALADPALPAPLRRLARVTLALALKRARQWDEAALLWRDLIRAEARRKAPDPWPYSELAKYQEHIARDYPAAIATVEAALALLALRGVATGRDELRYRLARLQRKQSGPATQRPTPNSSP